MTGGAASRGVGSTCKLRALWWTEGEEPVEGDFLRTAAGSCYRIDAVKPGRKAGTYTLTCTRLGKDAVQEGDPGVTPWVWSARARAAH